MKTLIIVGVLVGCLFFAPTVSAHDDGPSYEEIEDQAIFDCHNKPAHKVDLEIIRQIISVEKKYNLPPSLRGMLLAAACSESGYNPNALGDWRVKIKRGKRVREARAVGLFQMWRWWEESYKIDRRSVVPATEAYMKHISRQLKRIKCKWRTPHRRWIAAWVTAIRAPSKTGRCNQKPKHLRVLKRWHRNIKASYESGCGC